MVDEALRHWEHGSDYRVEMVVASYYREAEVLDAFTNCGLSVVSQKQIQSLRQSSA